MHAQINRRILRSSQACAALFLLGFSLHAIFWRHKGLDSFFNEWVYNGLVLAAATSCIVRAVRIPANRAAWLLLGIGLALWSAAEIINTVYLTHLSHPPYPSISDALWLAFYPASGAALLLLARGRSSTARRGTLWLDALVAALAVAALAEAVVFQPVIKSSGGSFLQVATDLAYPLCDLLLLSLVVGVCAITGWRPGRAWTLIGAGLVIAVAADCIYAYQAAKGSYIQGNLVDALWPAATLLVGYAAWEPIEKGGGVRRSGWQVLYLPTGFALMALGLLVWDHFSRIDTLATVLATLTLGAIIVRTALTFGDNLKMLRASRQEAMTDALTGLGNRRQLMLDLLTELVDATEEAPLTLVLLDLDGFKRYNDNFGHPAGDSLLARLGSNLAEAIGPGGRAYRLGGDEFCVLLTVTALDAEPIIEASARALTEHGKGFVVGASHGAVYMPSEASDAGSAMQLADQRLYERKAIAKQSSEGAVREGADGAPTLPRRLPPVSQQTRDVLLAVLHARQPDLHSSLHEVAELALAVGHGMALGEEQLDEMMQAAELHDVGKMAIPDEILNKPGPLDAGELRFVRQHTIVGERILSAAPALDPVGRIVRATHENFDGSGYPDGIAGEEIPIASRIIAVCDAFHAITSDRPHQDAVGAESALVELRRCAGTHFDPLVVEAMAAHHAWQLANQFPDASVRDRDALDGQLASQLPDGTVRNRDALDRGDPGLAEPTVAIPLEPESLSRPERASS